MSSTPPALDSDTINASHAQTFDCHAHTTRMFSRIQCCRWRPNARELSSGLAETNLHPSVPQLKPHTYSTGGALCSHSHRRFEHKMKTIFRLQFAFHIAR
eukprot:2292769-Pleurochrysis_carterae.AAC.1